MSRFTEWLSKGGITKTQWGEITNEEWCKKEMARCENKGWKVRLLERGKRIAIARA